MECYSLSGASGISLRFYQDSFFNAISVESPALFRFQPVAGSPFYLFVYHEIVCVSKCTISGVGVSLATVGFYSSFQIASFDAFSNEVVNFTFRCSCYFSSVSAYIW